MARRTSGTQWIGASFAIAVAIGAALYWSYGHRDGDTVPALPNGAPAVDETPRSAVAAPTQTTAIEHPIEQASVAVDPTADAALPPIEESDLPIFDGIAAVAGGEALGALVNPQHLVQRIVATVDGLTRPKLGEDISPVRGAQGTFATRGDGALRVVAADNAARYEPYMVIVRAVDARKLVSWYVHVYPLFQGAYRELGYPNAYFNDRLVAVIDHLLATPPAPAVIAVTQPKVMYEYADPALESRSAGQKLMLRIGPSNEAAVKAKLREIRAALVGQSLPAG